jgi:hypothetical protein
MYEAIRLLSIVKEAEGTHKLRLMLPKAVEDLQNMGEYLKWHKFATYIGGL